MSCLLYPLSYIAVVDMVAFDAGTHEQQSCRAPVWFEPQPHAPNTDQDLGNDERGGRSSEYGAGDRIRTCTWRNSKHYFGDSVGLETRFPSDH